jgi:O-antigen ligase
MYAVSIVSISLVVFSFVDFRSFGLLGLDFGNFLSESNTQGRSVIWNALLASYSDSGIFRQLFGSGLDSDVIATALFSDNLRFEDKRAHNSFLYLLLSTGFVGFLLFHCLVIRSWSKVLSLYKDGTDTDVFIANVASALFFMYLWLSLTVEVIIRPQVMVLLFLFLGMVERRSSKVSMQGNPPGN